MSDIFYYSVILYLILGFVFFSTKFISFLITLNVINHKKSKFDYFCDELSKKTGIKKEKIINNILNNIYYIRDNSISWGLQNVFLWPFLLLINFSFKNEKE